MKEKKICKHLFIVSGKYFGLVCCPFCMKYFTKEIPCYWEETKERDKWIEIKIKKIGLIRNLKKN